jgi:hypothetical protein
MSPHVALDVVVVVGAPAMSTKSLTLVLVAAAMASQLLAGVDVALDVVAPAMSTKTFTLVLARQVAFVKCAHLFLLSCEA